MKKYINRKYITIFSIIIIIIFLLGNYFTCPQYIIPIGLDSFNAYLVLLKSYRFDSTVNSTVVCYSNPILGEADFGLIAFIRTLHGTITSEDISEIIVVVKKISERIYDPLMKGFAIIIEGVNLFAYRNDTNMDLYSIGHLHSVFSSHEHSAYYFVIQRIHNQVPRKLYAHVNYAVHVIINPYAEIWYSEYKYITIGFHVKVYSGSVTIPITIIIPE
jgi:hypothetical protein